VAPGQSYYFYIYYDCTESSGSYTGSLTITSSGTVEIDPGGCVNNIFDDDDSGTAYIRIDPVTTGSCTNYELEVIA